MALCSSHQILTVFLALAVAFAETEDDDVVQIGGVKEEEAVPVSDFRVLNLNRYIFHGNVVSANEDSSSGRWMVLFCPSWWEPCQKIAGPYAEMSGQWQTKLNTALMTKDVQFAQVDCATDKPLCNDQSVESYPTVHHYSGGKRISTWSGGRKDDPDRLTKWMTKQLEPVATAKRQEEQALVQLPEPTLKGVVENSKNMIMRLSFGEYTLDALLIIGILALISRAVCENPKVWEVSQRSGVHAGSGLSAPFPMTEDPAATISAPASLHMRNRVSRFLPEEWLEPPSGIEL